MRFMLLLFVFVSVNSPLVSMMHEGDDAIELGFMGNDHPARPEPERCNCNVLDHLGIRNFCCCCLVGTQVGFSFCALVSIVVLLIRGGL